MQAAAQQVFFENKRKSIYKSIPLKGMN